MFRAASLAAAFTGALLFGSGIVVTLFFQLGRGEGVVESGLSLLGFAGATAVAAPFVGGWVDRVGASPVCLPGAGLAVVATAALAVVGIDAPTVLVQALLVAYGLAIALVAMPTGIAAYKAVRPAQLPDATTQVNILQRVGGSVGAAVFAVLIAARLPDAQAAFGVGFGALCAGSLGALAAAVLIRRAEHGATR